MVTWDTAVYKYDEDSGKMIGCSVTIYSDTGDKIDTIEIADAAKLQELEDALSVIDSTYVTYTDLMNIIANAGGATNINATTLNGLDGSTFITQSQAQNMSFNPKAHASAQQIYGVGSTSQYGHVKLFDALTHSTYVSGEALSSRQGYVLDQKIKALQDNNSVQSYSPHSHFQFMKRNGVVTLTIDDWDAVDYIGRVTGRWVDINLNIPDTYKPAIPTAANVKNLYVPNLFNSGNDVRMRINFESGTLQVWLSTPNANHFSAQVDWIARI